MEDPRSRESSTASALIERVKSGEDPVLVAESAAVVHHHYYRHGTQSPVSDTPDLEPDLEAEEAIPPPGMESTVTRLKQEGAHRPYAVAWALFNRLTEKE